MFIKIKNICQKRSRKMSWFELKVTFNQSKHHICLKKLKLVKISMNSTTISHQRYEVYTEGLQRRPSNARMFIKCSKKAIAFFSYKVGKVRLKEFHAL